MNKIETAIILAKDFQDAKRHDIIKFINELYRLSKTLERLNLIFCNDGLTDKQELKFERTKTKVKLLCDGFGLPCKIENDPRGVAVKLYFPSKFTNSFVSDGWGIIC